MGDQDSRTAADILQQASATPCHSPADASESSFLDIHRPLCGLLDSVSCSGARDKSDGGQTKGKIDVAVRKPRSEARAKKEETGEWLKKLLKPLEDRRTIGEIDADLRKFLSAANGKKEDRPCHTKWQTPPGEWLRNALKQMEDRRTINEIDADLRKYLSEGRSKVQYGPSRANQQSAPRDWLKNLLSQAEDRRTIGEIVSGSKPRAGNPCVYRRAVPAG